MCALCGIGPPFSFRSLGFPFLLCLFRRQLGSFLRFLCFLGRNYSVARFGGHHVLVLLLDATMAIVVAAVMLWVAALSSVCLFVFFFFHAALRVCRFALLSPLPSFSCHASFSFSQHFHISTHPVDTSHRSARSVGNIWGSGAVVPSPLHSRLLAHIKINRNNQWDACVQLCICELDRVASSSDWNAPRNEPQYVRVNCIGSKLPRGKYQQAGNRVTSLP